MEVKDALRQLMTEENLSPEHIAVASGKSVFSVARWLDGADPKYVDVARIAKAYPRFAKLLKIAA